MPGMKWLIPIHLSNGRALRGKVRTVPHRGNIHLAFAGKQLAASDQRWATPLPGVTSATVLWPSALTSRLLCARASLCR